jgi:Zn-finger nucleic acid-binding protein
MNFRDVPLDICPDCGGIWLGARDLEILAEKDHRTWFEKWFRG